MTMIKHMHWLLFAGIVAGGCAAEADNVSLDGQLAEEPRLELGGFDQAAPGKGTILSEVQQDGHLIQFVELDPGVNAVVEVGPLYEAPLVENAGSRGLPEIYATLTGATAPDVLVDADLLASERAAIAAATLPELEASALGDGPVLLDSGEQEWFRGEFCNGADVCSQGWDWASTGTVQFGSGTFFGVNGRESTQNASLRVQYWYCKSQSYFLGIPIACGDCGCRWEEYRRVLVVPGHWASIGVSGASYWQGDISGGGANTQVSIAARR